MKKDMTWVIRIQKALQHGMAMILRPQETSQQKIQQILAKSDAEALQEDWGLVGNDIRHAINQYTRTHE